jgi:hypothetical protein
MGVVNLVVFGVRAIVVTGAVLWQCFSEPRRTG